MTTRYFTNKEGFVAFSSEPALAYISMEDGIWIGHRIDGSTVDMPLLMLVEVCQNIIDGTWVELTEPPKIAREPEPKPRLTLVEAAIELHKVWMDIRNFRDKAGELDKFMREFGYADDAWCRVEEVVQFIDNPPGEVKEWLGHDDMPIGTVSGNVVEVEYQNGRSSVGFVHEFHWPHRNQKNWDIVNYRVIY